MSVADWTGSCLDWATEFDRLKAIVGSALPRRELRATAAAFLDGVLSGAARKTGWMLSEAAGFERPYRMQSLLGRSRWSADGLRDAVRGYAVAGLGDADGVLVIDETGFVKKGRHSVGVGRQYSGTAGRIENAQVGVFAAYAGRWGHTLIDRRLYLPRDWAEDGERRARVGVPDEVVFATKPAMARDMIAANLDAGLPCAWVLADAAYGSDYKLRRMLEERSQPYVLAVRSNHPLRFFDDWQLVQTDPASMADELSPGDWQPLSAGEGAKGMRLYDWACMPLKWDAPGGFARWLLVRRSQRDPKARTFYFAFAPMGTGLAELAAAAGLRWTIEECFLRAKDDLGLDHCEARSWHGWHRHMTLVMAAAAFLATLSAEQRRQAYDGRTGTDARKANETSPHDTIDQAA